MTLKLARTTTIGITGLFILAAIAFLASPVSAQVQPGTASVVVTMTTKDIGAENRLSPEAELGEVEVKATIQLSNVGGGCIVPYTVKFTVTQAPPYASTVLNPAQASGSIDTSSAAGAQAPPAKDAVSKLLISTTRDAPAFKDDTYKVKAEVTFGQTSNVCLITTPSPAEGQTSVKNDYLPLTQVTPAQYFQKAGQNKKVTFPIDAANLGNGPTRVKIDVTQPNKNKLDSIIPPAELHLESRATKGAAALFKQTTRIEAQTPHSNGYTNSIFSFNVKFTSAYDGAGQGTTGDETAITLSIQVQGVYVPGFDPVSAIAALGIALGGVALRRKA